MKMLWQNIDDTFVEELQTQSYLSILPSKKILDDHEEKKAIQLKKYQDPATDPERQAYITIAAQFGDLIANNHIDEMVITMLTEDCEFFVFDSSGRNPVKYSLKPDGTKGLYRGVHFQERLVQETYVDSVKSTVVQLSKCKILYQDEKVPAEEYSIEIFTIRDGKISKYRASFGCRPSDEEEDPLEPTKKDKILAKVKRINYALAGSQPDLNKVAALFNESTEYKVWSWGSQNCFTLNKHNFVENFINLDFNLAIKCIVPYEVFTDKKYVVGTYVYYLEGTSGIYMNQKFVWLSTCVYAFDVNLNLIRVIQQGELHHEDSVNIPFEAFSRESVTQKIQEGSNCLKASLDMFYSSWLTFSCPMYRFAPEGVRFRGHLHGMNQVDEVLGKPKKINMNIELKKFAEAYIDSGDASYDVAVVIGCNPGTISNLEHRNELKPLNHLNIMRICLENGKVAKSLLFTTHILEPVPSPFEDPEFEAQNIKPKSDFM